ncbi:MAG: cytochrome d ubiquinol oxidase subunit II [Firmicutes bacterium]|nr:cytochrome d ubiquinol oxidase subunit II [Bacillota bacterium]
MHELLGVIAYGIIGLAYFIYLVQEIPIIGVGILNIFIAPTNEEKKKLQSIAGLYSDGVEVWLIVAVGLTFAAFPDAFGQIFSGIYVPAFLLLAALIFRGLSVELIFKDDQPKWIKYMSLAWSISGILLMFVLGVFFVSIFTGFPYENRSMGSNIFNIFSTASISGGLLMIVLAFIIGTVWIKLNRLPELSDKAFGLIKKYGIIYAVPFLFALVLMGINNNVVSIISGQLFVANPVLIALPLASLFFFILVTLFSHLKKAPFIFGSYVLGLSLFFISGYLGTYPYILFSSVAFNEGITITESMASQTALVVMSVVILIVLPVVLLYQGYKYVYFFRKDKH